MAWLNTTLRLSSDTKRIKTKTGTSMTTGFGFMDVGSDSDHGLSIVSFGEIADELIKYKKGVTIAVTGNLQMNIYTNKDDVEVKQLQIVLDGLSGVKRRNPVHQKPKEKDFKPAHSNFNQLNDDLNF